MDKRYIKLNDELVEIVGKDLADATYAPIDSPNFTGSGTVESTDTSNDKSIVNLEHLKKELSNVDTRYDEISSSAESFTTTLDEISKIASVKTTTGDLTSISLDPSSVTSYPGLVDSENRVDNSRAGVIAIEGVKLLINSMTGGGGIQDSITNINNTLSSIQTTIQEMKDQLEVDLTEIRNQIELLNIKLTTLELGNDTTRSSKSRKR